MTPRMLVFVPLLALAPAAVAQEPAPIPEAADTESAIDPELRRLWLRKIARMEGASVDVEEAAAALAATAQSIADAGRVQDVALLSHQAHELRRKVISAGMAADVLDEL